MRNFGIVFGMHFLHICLDCGSLLGSKSAPFSIIFASLFRASFLYRFFIDLMPKNQMFRCFLVPFWHQFSMQFRNRQNLIFCNKSNEITRFQHHKASHFGIKNITIFRVFWEAAPGPHFLHYGIDFGSILVPSRHKFRVF